MIVITKQPTDFYSNTGVAGIQFSVSAIDTDGLALSYQWEYRNTSNQNWQNSSVESATSPIIILTRSADYYQERGYEYRCKISNGTDSVYTFAVKPLVIGSSYFQIALQQNNSEPIKLDKDLTEIATLAGTLREECSIIDPVVLLEVPLDQIAGCNYVTISAFGRSYFVREIISVRTGLVRLSLHVDVLTSFKDGIRANKGIVRRAEKADTYNLYLNDGSLQAYQDPYILTEPFPYGFTGACFIMATAGG